MMIAVIASIVACGLIGISQATSVDVFLTCVDICDVYIDGERVHANVSSSTRISIPKAARLVAIEAKQTIHIGDGYIEMWPVDNIMETASYVSQTFWKCTDVEEASWTDPLFDDQDWATAGVVDAYLGYMGSRGQRRIWARAPTVDVYCRMWMPNDGTCKDVPDSAKIGCASDDTFQGECERRGCCYKDTGNANVPKCFFTFEALPNDLDDPVTSVVVPRSFGRYTLHKTDDQSAVVADMSDNMVLGAYRTGGLVKCFRACVLTQCGSMYLHGSDDSCILYSKEQPMMTMATVDAQWAFYKKYM